jgi:hypothetical protein
MKGSEVRLNENESTEMKNLGVNEEWVLSEVLR